MVLFRRFTAHNYLSLVVSVDASLTPIPLLSSLRLFQSRPASFHPDQDTLKFVREFDLEYRGDTVTPSSPPLHDSSYQSAVSRAFNNSKFLLVYLHSPMHEDTDRFCRNVLCSQTFAAFAQDVVVWAGCVWDPEAYGLSTQMRVSCFPFVGLLLCHSDRSVEVVDKVQGYMDETALVERLRNGMTAQGGALTRRRQEATMRQESSRLREQQDREYQEAEAANRRESQRRREEEERKEREAEEAREREELQAALDLSERLTRESVVSKKRMSLPAEPAAGPDVATVRLQLPTGVKFVRRFHRSDPAQTIFDFLAVYFADNSLGTTRFSLSTFDKIEIRDGAQGSVEEHGLHPRAMLYVHDLDA